MERDQLLLRPSKLKWSVVALASAAFAAAGVVVLFTSSVAGGLVVAGFFGLCAAFSIYPLFGKRTYLLLTPEGFTVAGLLGRGTVAWSRVRSFEPQSLNLGGWVSVRYTDHDGRLPDTYGLGARRLAALLNEWKARYSP